MLTIEFSEKDLFNNFTSEFITIPAHTAQLEYSLRALSAWESKWEKSVINSDNRTTDEIISLVQCMSLNGEIPRSVIEYMNVDEADQLMAYINSTQTATVISDSREKKAGPVQTITTEVIYSWMVEYKIPFETQDWHLNRLLTLIDVISVNNSDEKVPEKEVLKSNSELNALRKKQLNTKG